MKSLLFFFILVLFSLPVFADYTDYYLQAFDFFEGQEDGNTGLVMFPSLLVPAGGKYEGMGTAFTGVIDNSSYFEANPAGGANGGGRSVSFWHKNWIADSAINALAFTSQNNAIGAGFGVKVFYSPFTAYDDLGERVATGYFTEGVIAGNFAGRLLRIKDSFILNLGVSPKLVVRYVPPNIDEDQTFVAFPFDIGVLGKIDFKNNQQKESMSLSIGIAVKNLGRKVFDVGYPLPTVASAGIGFSPLVPVTLSFDVHYPISYYPDEFPAEKPSYASGISVDFTEAFGLHAGMHMKADSPKATIGGRVMYEGAEIITNYNVDFINGINVLQTFSIELTYYSEAGE